MLFTINGDRRFAIQVGPGLGIINPLGLFAGTQMADPANRKQDLIRYIINKGLAGSSVGLGIGKRPELIGRRSCYHGSEQKEDKQVAQKLDHNQIFGKIQHCGASGIRTSRYSGYYKPIPDALHGNNFNSRVFTQVTPEPGDIDVEIS